MLLTCPTCHSGLEVPDGTTALVRCPACKAVFAPSAGLAASETEPEDVDDEHEEEDEEEERDRPRRSRKARAKEQEAEDESNNRDFEPGYFDDKPRKRRRAEEKDSLTSAERDSLRAAFTRAAWGCKLIWISYILFMFSMALIALFWLHLPASKFMDPRPQFIIAAGVLSIVYWILAPIGVGLCMTGPTSPGHWGYGIGALVACVLHGILLIVLVAQANEFVPGKLVGKADNNDGMNVQWWVLPTRLDALASYLALAIYHEEIEMTHKALTLSIVVGLAEMVRNIFLLMFISCMARAAGDEDLSDDCTRAAGFASFGLGILAVLMLLMMIGLVETKMMLIAMNRMSDAAGNMIFGLIYLCTTVGVYLILMWMMFPSLVAARDAAEACEEPFESQIPKL